MRNRSRRLHRLLLFAVFALLSLIATPKPAYALTEYGATTTRSGFGYTFSGNTLVSISNNMVSGGVRLQTSPGIYWDAPLISVELYEWISPAQQARVASRPLSSAIGSSTVWSAETSHIQIAAPLYITQGRVVCYDSTYMHSVDFYLAEASGGLPARSASPSSCLTPCQPVQQLMTNDYGQTYGSDMLSYETGISPDLVLVKGSSGQYGYVYSSDFERIDSYGKMGQSIPAEDRILTVYDSDGRTPIDSYILSI